MTIRNPYITQLDNDWLRKISKIVEEMFVQQQYFVKDTKYTKVINAIFSYAVLNGPYPTGILPDDEIAELTKRIRENVNAFSNLGGQEYSLASNENPKWTRQTQNLIETSNQQLLLDLLPAQLREHKITFIFQTQDIGHYLMIHKDHERTSGLFYLLTDADAETRFYEPKTDFKIVDKARSASINDVTLEHSQILQKGNWYAFNHKKFHSVHALDVSRPLNRSSFIIEFVDLPYNDLMEILKEEDNDKKE
jgi:hypothetical protein